MSSKRPGRTTIAVMPDVRDSLKHIARKDQDYNDLLKDLIELFENQKEKVPEGELLKQMPPSSNQTQNDDTQDIQTPTEERKESERL